MATKPQLSREYLYFPFAEMNFDVDDLTFQKVAFTDEGVEPTDPDWQDAIVVNSAHALFQPTIGEGLAILVGPTRGDSVTTFDPPDGDSQVWIDVKVTGSDERVVRVAGILSNTVTGE